MVAETIFRPVHEDRVSKTRRYCTITDFYKSISRNPRLEIKLEILEDMGLISCDIVHGHRMYTLTLKGETVAEYVLKIDDVIGNMR